MERAEAEAIYEQGRETVVAVLLELAAQNALLTREVAELIERAARQDERLARQDERIAELERRLSRNSRNSSLPPSLDPPAAPERRQPAPSGRGQGAQPGHPGRGRHLAPLEAVDELIEHWPERCVCGHCFSEAERHAVGKPARHQVAELPEVAVLLCEHRLQRLRCPECGAVTRAALPAAVPRGAFGPRLQAAVATLAVRNRVSRRDAVELLRELFGAALSRAAIDAIVQHAGEALDEPYEDLLRHIRCAAAVNIDETGWRLRGGKRTFWGVLTSRAAVFRIAPDRHRREAQALLGEDFSGIACSDRWWAYAYLDPQQRQLCWAHLVRDFTAHSEGLSAQQKAFGLAGLEIAGRLFAAWDAYRKDGDRTRLLVQSGPLKQELRELLEQAARKSAKTRYQRTFAKNLLKGWPALWTFTSVPGVDPTNNHAERGLRGAVIYRKLSLGSQSEEGERTIARLLSASVTCRLQRRSLFAYLSAVLSAHICGDPAPLLT
jgi:transposase